MPLLLLNVSLNKDVNIDISHVTMLSMRLEPGDR